MPFNGNVNVPAGTWTQLTANDVAAISVQNLSLNRLVFVMATAGAVAPSGAGGGLRLDPSEAVEGLSLAGMFSGVASPTRVYGWSDSTMEVFVSHA